ncbi:MAG: hypothetical protein IPG34_19740 [Rhodocyclaceae bacterium]|nr:hypothetical protein [Rhodocyclaceae bacterium]
MRERPLEERAKNYIEAAIAQTLRRVMAAPQGQRNDALNTGAFSMGRMVAAGWIGPEQAAVQLLQACESNGLLKDDGPRNCGATIASGLKKGQVATPAFLPPELQLADLGVINIRPLDPQAGAEAMRVEEQRRLLEAQNALEAEARLTNKEYFEEVASALLRHVGALKELARRGIDQETAEAYGLGYDDFPLGDAPERYGPPGRRPSLVLPWEAIGRPGHYDAVQYRHLDGEAPKVHWHHDLRKGRLFNPSALTHPHSDELYVVEGALTALTLISAGITSTVALPQLRPKAETVEALARRDGGSIERTGFRDAGAAPIWSAFAAKVPDGRGRVVPMPVDPDEYLLSMGCDVDRFATSIRMR